LPTLDRNEPVRIVAQQLGHPLLAEGRRVCNDVELGPSDRVLLVTGSNMSGKSTLLRAVGVNLVLAQMGSVVCAQALRFHPVEIETSMRIADSLADGVSFFMAELKRLKAIVDHAEEIRVRRVANPVANNASCVQPAMLFLLDEVLQGTNSRERHLAVQAVVDQLLRSGAIGAVTTHDLDLASATSGLGSRARPVYFTEHFAEVDGQSVMQFDYRMREGVAPTTNAIKLMRLVGLSCEDNSI
jgi:DNA mismatch repair ATPase MutS